MTRSARLCYGIAICMTILRLMLYYSIISKRLYILRLTISRATARLIPTLVLLCAALLSFAIGGNQLYYATTYEWRDLPSSLGTVLYLLRRPMGMNWERMAQSAMIWPLDSEEPSALRFLATSRRVLQTA